MNFCNILSTLWKHNKKYSLTDEEIVLENTFIQQTRKDENLWKAQLGLTRNYVIFLRCDSDLDLNGVDHNTIPKQLNILINMIPKSHLKVKKYSKRKLKILFPSGCTSYFKLLICSGCGKGWSHWRTLAQICDVETQPLVSRSCLISFSDLDSTMQKMLLDEKFFVHFTNISEYPSRKINSATQKPDISSSLITEKTYSMTEGSVIDVRNRSRTGKDIATTEESVSDKNRSRIGKSNSIEEESSNDKSVFLRIKRSSFIDGIDTESRHPITGHESDSKNHFSGIKNFPDNKKQKEEANEVERDSKGSQKVYSRVQSETMKKKGRKRKPIRRFGEGIPENCIFELTLSYSDELVVKDQQTKLDAGSKIYDDMSFEKLALKILGKSATGSKENGCNTERKSEEKTTYVKRKKTNYLHMDILKTSQFFTNVSLLVIPDALRKSKSVDSVFKISEESRKISATINVSLSLPNVNEIPLHRRYDRLSYSTDDFDDTKRHCSSENHSTQPISFWLPNEKPHGRIFCTNPVCRKESAYKSYAIRKEHLQKNTTISMSNNRLNVMHTKKGNENKREKEEDPISYLRMSAKARDKKKKISKRNSDCNKRTLKVTPSEPQVVAFELQQIQQRMFCEIETSEFARFILSPNTVTEVNCPYLCGFLFFFERLRTLVMTEISTQSRVEDAARIHRLFVKVALACLKRRDEQSAYAIIGGLCSPTIVNYKQLWSYMLQQNEDVKYLWYLFRTCQQGRNLTVVQQKIPFFLNFITFLTRNLLHRETESLFTLNMNKDILAAVLSYNKKRNSNKRNLKVFSELKILSYGNLETVFYKIEECRKYFFFENVQTTDIATREYLLYKEYSI